LHRESTALKRRDNLGKEFKLQPIGPTFIGCIVRGIRTEVKAGRTSCGRVDEAFRAVCDTPFDNNPIVAGADKQLLPIANSPVEGLRIK